jgi:hypothetical protein
MQSWGGRWCLSPRNLSSTRSLSLVCQDQVLEERDGILDQVAKIRRQAASIDPATLVRQRESRRAQAREFGVSRQQALSLDYVG